MNGTVVLTYTGQCGIDNIGCANEYIHGRTHGTKIAGYYNWENNQDVVLGKLEFVMPKKTKDGIIAVSFFLAVFGLATIVFGGIWIKTCPRWTCPWFPQAPPPAPAPIVHTVVQIVQVAQTETDENPKPIGTAV